MKKLVGLFFLIISLSFGSMVNAQEHEQANLLELMKKTYQDMTAMSCDFEQTLVHRESGSKTIRPGVLKFKKPLLVHWEVSGKDSEVLIIGKEDIWNYLPDEEVAYRYSLEMIDSSNSFIKVVTGQSNLREDFEIDSESQTDGLIEYHLYPRQPTQQLTEAYMWIEPGTGIIKRVKILDFFGNENDITFKSTDLNANVPDKIFSFAPLKGVDVEDHFENNGVPERTLFQ